MMDTILISGLAFDTVIGVYDWERHTPQTLLVDLSLDVDLEPAARSDDVAQTVDYAAVADCVAAVGNQSKFELLEALAGAIISRLLGQFDRVHSVQLCLTKPGILPKADRVAIQMTRGR